MKKSNSKRLTMIFSIVFGLLLGMVIISTHFFEVSGLDLVVRFAEVFLFLTLSAYIHIALHEAGHLVAGLISGYHFVSYRFGKTMVMHDSNGKLVKKKYAVAGTGGQCIMGPPEYSDELPTTLYNYGGGLANLLLAVISLIIYLLINNIHVKVFFSILGLIGVFLAATNLIPLTSDMVTNDGANEREVRKSNTARKAFWSQLKVTELISEGVNTRDIPEEYFDFEPDPDNYMINASYVMKINRYMNPVDYEKCRVLMEDFLDKDYPCISMYKYLFRSDLLFCKMLNDEEVKKEYKELEPVLVKMRTIPGILRTMYAYDKLVLKDEAQAGQILQQFEAVMANYPYPQDSDIERGLIALVDSKVYNLNNKVG